MEESIKELAYTTSGENRGSALSTSYQLQGVLFLKKIKDAAKKRLYFTQACYVTSAPKGTKDVVIPRRTAYLGSSGVTAVVAEADTDITATTMDNLTGVTITPVMSLARISITNYALRVSTLELVRAAQEELVYSIGDRVDQAVATKFGDATAATSSARGAQCILGGDATTDATLAVGDILTTDIMAKARRYLKSPKCRYWSGGTEGTSSQAKNPWTEGHMLFIGDEQEECLLKDSQFTNAAEFGGREAILNGQIARYLGTDIIVAPNTESAIGGATAPDGTTMASGVDMHRCILTSKGNGVALVWGLEPQLNIVPRPERSQQQIILESAYACGVIHDDAIVWIDVTDK
ncbi:MAG: hypothetical protein ABIB43_01700 [archaeon]